MDRSMHEIRMANWKGVIQQCLNRPADQTAKQWLAENGISPKKYYYWQRKIRKYAVAEMKPALPRTEVPQEQEISLAEISLESLGSSSDAVPAVTIRTERSTIEITTAVSESAMIELIKAVSHAL